MCLGCGLLVRRVSGGALSGVLLAPVGFALMVVICAFFTSYGWLTAAAGPVVVAATLAGYALAARERHDVDVHLGPPRHWIWPLIAAAVAFAAVGGPVFLTGSVGWTGYTRIVDIAFQMDFAQHLADAGRVSPSNGDSSYNIVAAKLLSIGYPGGAQATLGVTAELLRINVAWCYQAFLAFATAMGATAIFATLGRITLSGWVRCAGAAAAIQPNILYAYTLEAGIKELGTTVMLMTLLATVVEQPPWAGSRRAMIAAAIAASGAFACFSLGVGPWLGLALGGLFVISLLRRSGHWRVLQNWAVLVAVALVTSIPGLITAAKLATVAGPAVGGVVNLGLGNLAVPVSRWAAVGIWLTGDYRFGLAHVTVSHVLDIVVIALAVIGVLATAVRRQWTISILGLAVPGALYYFIQHSSAWIQLKSFTVTGSFALLLAFAGAASLLSARRKWLAPLGAMGGAAVIAGVLYGNALTYHDTTLAPGARYEDLAAIANRYAGRGPALDPWWDEYAELLLRGVDGSTIVDPANLSFRVRPGTPLPPGGVSFGWDLNQLEPDFVQSFPLIIQPRSPIASRAPANYDLVALTRYFEVWRRDRPSNTVLAHFPLSSQPTERTPRYCSVFDATVRRAGPRAQVAYVKSSAAAIANPLEGSHPDYWRPLGPGTLAALGAGTAQMRVRLMQSGRFGIWLQGSVGRPVTLYVDGRRLARIGYEERYPGEFLLLASTTLKAGTHTLRLVRGNGSLHPGSGDFLSDIVERTLGVIVFEREDSAAGAVYVAPAAAAPRLCTARVGYQWLEVLAPGGAPADALRASIQ